MAQLTPSQFARTSYSILGYTLPGILILFLLIIDHDASVYYQNSEKYLISHKILTSLKSLSNISFSFTEVAIFSLFILFCYILGLFISGLSSLFIERIFVKNVLKFPSVNLFSKQKDQSGLFKNYRKPFDRRLQKQIIYILKKKSNLKKIQQVDYYWMAHTVIFKEYSEIQSRIDHWVTLYGLNRNLSMSIILYVFFKHLIIWINPNLELIEVSNIVSLVYLVIAGTLFWNYLKLFKRNAIDLFMNLLVLKEKASNRELEIISNKGPYSDKK
jgi:hypothetical protein